MNLIEKYKDAIDLKSEPKHVIYQLRKQIIDIVKTIDNKNFFIATNNKYSDLFHIIRLITQRDSALQTHDERQLTVSIANKLEEFLIDEEFQTNDYKELRLQQKYLVNTNNNEFLIMRNNKLDKYDFDAKINNTNIYIDIKGRYNPYYNMTYMDPYTSLYIDCNTICKYYCRMLMDNLEDVWFIIYFNYGIKYDIRFINMKTLLNYISIDITEDDIKNYSLVVKNGAYDRMPNFTNKIKLLTNINNKDEFDLSKKIMITDQFVNINYEKLSLTRNEFYRYVYKKYCEF